MKTIALISKVDDLYRRSWMLQSSTETRERFIERVKKGYPEEYWDVSFFELGSEL